MSETNLLQPHWVVHDSSVEALFVRAYGGKIAQHSLCLNALKAAGIDPTGKLKPSYPATVYEKGMQLLREHLFASTKSDAEAYWAIGRETTAGFYRTLVGTALGGVMKLLKPERMLPRLPANIVSSTNFMKSSVVEKAPHHFELHVFGTNTPCFIAGAVERGVEQTGTRPKVEIIREAPLEAWYAITW
jgi:uncharacterized protein (TIGR02265 family)